MAQTHDQWQTLLLAVLNIWIYYNSYVRSLKCGFELQDETKL